ncbi:MAG TPA: carboxypeptidase-like regulatory domain-containing protein [Terriglobia bacterium]|nr:carboxypeptidase-like regulatory domain-containing protein [Terriglobia bacterium]
MVAAAARAGKPAPAPELTVSLAPQRPDVAQPFPARVMLQFHNAGAKPLWLYRHVRDPMDRARTAETNQNTPGASNGGSRLIVHLERAQAPEWSEPPHGTLMASVDMPHPHMVFLAPGGDLSEGAVIALEPGLVAHQGGAAQPVWGKYQLSVSYQASYSNGDALSRDLGIDIWQGEARSNTVDVDLEPAPASALGTITGKVTNRDGHPLVNMEVSLSDHENHVIGQIVTDIDGAFTFPHLPTGTYWVTARRVDATYETAVFEHTDVGTAGTANVHLVMLEPDLYEGKQFWHKPVLFQVTDNAGRPLGGIEIDALKTNGTVAETVKGETDANGTAALDLIPGSIYVTLKRRKCQTMDTRVEIGEGDGIDGSILEMDCK